MQAAIVYKWQAGCFYPLYLCAVFYDKNHCYYISKCIFRFIPFYLAVVADHADQSQRHHGSSFHDPVPHEP